MMRLIRGNLVIAAGVALLALFASIGAFAAPGVTPWPDPFDASGAPAGPDDQIEATETLEATETPELGDADLPDDADSDPQDDVDVEGEDGQGVPPDSPACAGDLEDPNPHDTDGDGDGCREVETEDGTTNLPDPAADAQEGNPGNIGDGNDDDVDGDDHEDCGLGPPDGRPRDGRSDGDPPYGPPTDVPLGPRTEPCVTPTPAP